MILVRPSRASLTPSRRSSVVFHPGPLSQGHTGGKDVASRLLYVRSRRTQDLDRHGRGADRSSCRWEIEKDLSGACTIRLFFLLVLWALTLSSSPTQRTTSRSPAATNLLVLPSSPSSSTTRSSWSGSSCAARSSRASRALLVPFSASRMSLKPSPAGPPLLGTTSASASRARSTTCASTRPATPKPTSRRSFSLSATRPTSSTSTSSAHSSIACTRRARPCCRATSPCSSRSDPRSSCASLSCYCASSAFFVP